MNLMTLRGLIRKPGNPTMVVDLGNGVPMTIAFQKTPLLEELGKAFNYERTAETALSYDPVTCTLSVDGFVGQAAEPEDLGWASEVSDDMVSDLDDEDTDPMSPVADRDPADDEDDDLL